MNRETIVLLVLLVMASGCSSTPMLAGGSPPNLKPDAHRATLVVVRDSSFMAGVRVWTYLDQELIGVTEGETWFVTKVLKGPHYVIAIAENNAVARFDFKAGRTYFLRQDIWKGWSSAFSIRVGLDPMNPREAEKAMKSSGYWIYDKNNPVDALSEEWLDEYIHEYDAAVREDSVGYSKIMSYDGY